MELPSCDADRDGRYPALMLSITSWRHPLSLAAILLLTILLPAQQTAAADLALLRDGRSDYEIVLPDAPHADAISVALAQSARLL
jgi:hypothetical protein